MIRRPPRSTQSRSSAASDVYKRQVLVLSPASATNKHRNWNRFEVADWLTERLSRDDRCIVGIDHGFSFPVSYFERNKIKSWAEFLDDFVQHWPTHEARATVEQFRENSQRVGDPSELRMTEKWTSSAKSVFRFDVQGSVAKSTHACLLYTSPSPRDQRGSRMPSSA